MLLIPSSTNEKWGLIFIRWVEIQYLVSINVDLSNAYRFTFFNFLLGFLKRFWSNNRNAYCKKMQLLNYSFITAESHHSKTNYFPSMLHHQFSAKIRKKAASKSDNLCSGCLIEYKFVSLGLKPIYLNYI